MEICRHGDAWLCQEDFVYRSQPDFAGRILLARPIVQLLDHLILVSLAAAILFFTQVPSLRGDPAAFDPVGPDDVFNEVVGAGLEPGPEAGIAKHVGIDLFVLVSEGIAKWDAPAFCAASAACSGEPPSAMHFASAACDLASAANAQAASCRFPEAIRGMVPSSRHAMVIPATG